MTRERELDLLRAMAHCHQSNTGRPPTTMKELADHWYGMYETFDQMAEQQDTDHVKECIWLRDVEKRPDGGWGWAS